jgi:hypothetical protein
MADREMYPVRLTRPWPSRRHAWAMSALLLSCSIVGLAAWLRYETLPPLQQHYLGPYLGVNWTPTQSARAYDVLSISRKGQDLMATDTDVQLFRGAFRLAPHRSVPGDRLRWIKAAMTPGQFASALRQSVYYGSSAYDLFRVPIALGVFAIPLLAFGLMADDRYLKGMAEGQVRRGPRLLSAAAFNLAMLPADGLGFQTACWHSWPRRLWQEQYLTRIAVAAATERNHILIQGDTGTGKSQLIIQTLRQVDARGETAIVYDPTGQFIAEFYNQERGDVILCPVDERCAYWEPANELRTNAEALTIAASLFPDGSSDNPFFVDTPRLLFAHLIQYAPSPHTLADWMANPEEILRRVEGTELAQFIAGCAPQQATGVLSSLNRVAHALRLLPPEAATSKRWSALQWAKERKGWIFLRTVGTTREAELPLITIWLDILILRLMEDSRVPVWVVIDELASLGILHRLKTAATELRKFNIRLVLGIQARSQVQSLYGEKDAQTVLQMCQTKIFLRINEPDAADWASRSIGDQEIEHLKISGHQTSGLIGKKSHQYVPEIRTQRAVTKEQIQGLPDLNAYIVCSGTPEAGPSDTDSNKVHKFRLPYYPLCHNVPALIERKQLQFVALGDPGPYTIRDPEPEISSQNTAPEYPPARQAGPIIPAGRISRLRPSKPVSAAPPAELAVPWVVKQSPGAVPPTVDTTAVAAPSGPGPSGKASSLSPVRPQQSSSAEAPHGQSRARHREPPPPPADQGSLLF